MADKSVSQGFVLSESAMYAFMDQDVFPDLVNFCAAIPYHLRPLFLIPISVEFSSGPAAVASRVASRRYADGPGLDGQSPEADWFGTKTFVYDDNSPTVPSSEPGSIFDIDGADEITHHQDLEENQDKNVQVPSDTSYMSDVDVTDSGFSYPYRTEERPLRHSTVVVAPRGLARLALKPLDLEVKAPEKIRDNAKSCSVSLVSYDKRGRVFTFNVGCGNGAKTVRAALTDIDHVAMSCSCPFWRWNGPEFHAKTNNYMLGSPRGTAGPPDVRDPDRKYFLCKHAYASLARLDDFVQQVVEENWELDDQEMMEAIDRDWDRLAAAADVSLEDAEENIADVEWEDEPEEGDPEEPAEAGKPEGEEIVEEDVEPEPEPDEETVEEEPEPEPEPEEEPKAEPEAEKKPAPEVEEEEEAK